ncbi:hypothetical protein [Bradyrhizobium japonicum]|uniref:hypothetical protein n=1 Tax=Bradyrhizobium japonicum TaxID=375 RepID=UPI001CB6B9CE|nr:hypothetical protein [Bradyrhizobium japonicum]
MAAAIAPSPTIDATSRRVTIFEESLFWLDEGVWLSSRKKFAHQSASAGWKMLWIGFLRTLCFGSGRIS